VIAITKYLIGVPPVNRFTATARALRQCGRTSDWMVRAGLMEKIMNKTKETGMSMFATETNRFLTDAELEEVNGCMASQIAYLHSVFIASASDLVFGGKGFVAEAAYEAARGYLRGQ
jgi:hypothetical protein